MRVAVNSALHPTLVGTTMLAVIALLAASGAAADERPLVLVVMDPLAAPLACDCVKGYAQRNYDVLGMYLRDKLGRPVRVVYGESLAKAIRGRGDDRVDLVIGKDSVVRFDAAERGLAMEPIARLTGKDGKTTLTGLVVVPSRDSARVLADLKGYRVFFGPAASVEKHAAAIDGLRKAGVAVPEKPEVVEGCSEAALAAIESDAKPGAAAVISSYALALLEGCGSIRKGELRIVGETEPTPFVTAFVPKSTPPALRSNILDGLIAMKEHPAMLLLMESQSGFVPVETPEPPAGKPADGGADKPAAPAATKGDLSAALGIPDRQWLQWRGRDRNAVVGWLPERLPAEPRVVWSRPMTGSGLAGIVATEDRVVVADRDPADRLDVVRCLEAASGEQVWQIEYPAPGKLDYGNSPRATPVVYEGRVYLLGAMGDLHCVTLADGAVVWKKNVLAEFGANRPNWGMCGSPLVVDGKLIVNPGGEAASVAALDPATGKVLWQSPGLPPAYSSFIVGRFGGVSQIVGYDALSLGGWDIATGKRLWQLRPPEKGDFNVPTPIDLGGKLLVATENNGARVYGFSDDGKIIPRPLAENPDFAPDTATPVVVDGKMYGAFGQFFCLDTADGLKPLWTAEDDAFEDHVAIIAARDRLLITTAKGELLLLDISGAGFKLLGRHRLFGEDAEVLSHPALAGRRLYVRDGTQVKCVQLEE